MSGTDNVREAGMTPQFPQPTPSMLATADLSDPAFFMTLEQQREKMLAAELAVSAAVSVSVELPHTQLYPAVSTTLEDGEEEAASIQGPLPHCRLVVGAPFQAHAILPVPASGL